MSFYVVIDKFPLENMGNDISVRELKGATSQYFLSYFDHLTMF